MPPWPMIESTRYLPSTTAPTLIEELPLPPTTTVGVNVGVAPAAAPPASDEEPARFLSRDKSTATPICTAMPRSSSRSSAVYGSSDRFWPSEISPTSGRGSLPPAKIGTRSAASSEASHARSAGGTLATGDCSSSRKISSGLSDHFSSVMMPLSDASGAASIPSDATCSNRPEAFASCRESDARMVSDSGWSAESICVTTIASSSRGSVSYETRPASETRISRASYSVRKNCRSSQRCAASRYFKTTPSMARKKR